ncbi:MAG: aminotransferase class I/II-fold pyridoxal phosphate-dependent enzyme [Polyangiales bacterium]
MVTTRVAPTQLIDKMARSIGELVSAGVVWDSADDVPYTGRHVVIDGRPLRNFGGCSYLGLEQRPELREAAIQAVHRYGTQFSFSRAYLECPLYRTLEAQLARITGGVPLVTASTSLGHLAALPVLVQPGDAMILDLAAHASLHTAASLVRGATLARARHNHLGDVERHITRLAPAHRRIWLLTDGVYSMHGDLAPLSELAALQERHPQLHLYVDDAHGTSWCGLYGRGHALARLRERSRVVVALSLNKAFSAAGGALVFPTDELRAQVRMCGGPMIFSGPVQPPMLGAAVAAAALHLAPDHEALQQQLFARIDLLIARARAHDVPLASVDRTPIFYVPTGEARRTIVLAQRLRERGFYACPSVFPAVSEREAGVRLTVSLHNTEEDIEDLMRTFNVLLAPQ